jgi:hypothetical protein
MVLLAHRNFTFIKRSSLIKGSMCIITSDVKYNSINIKEIDYYLYRDNTF